MVDINAEVARMREQLREAEAASRLAQYEQEQRQNERMRYEAANALELSNLVAKFVSWAQASRITPERSYERKAKRWALTQVVQAPQETANGRAIIARLCVYTDGYVAWTGEGPLAGTVPVPMTLQRGIVTFIAKSGSSVPWSA